MVTEWMGDSCVSVEQEYSLVKAKVKYDQTWSPNGWVTYVLRLCARSKISRESDSVQTLQKSLR